jgi:hypothetical protein
MRTCRKKHVYYGRTREESLPVGKLIKIPRLAMGKSPEQWDVFLI